MLQTNTVNIYSNKNEHIRLYVNKELFVDQQLPFNKTKLHLSYISDYSTNNIRVKTTNDIYSFKVSSNESIDLSLNK